MHRLCQECNHPVVSDSVCSPPGILWAVPDSQTQIFSVLVHLTLQGVVCHTCGRPALCPRVQIFLLFVESEQSCSCLEDQIT